MGFILGSYVVFVGVIWGIFWGHMWYMLGSYGVYFGVICGIFCGQSIQNGAPRPAVARRISSRTFAPALGLLNAQQHRHATLAAGPWCIVARIGHPLVRNAAMRLGCAMGNASGVVISATW